jgi:syntaxin 5
LIRSISSLTDDDVKRERERQTEREMSFMHRTPLTSGMNERSFPSSSSASSSSSAMSGTDRTREFFATAERVSKQMTRGGGGGEGRSTFENEGEEKEGGATTTTTTSGSDFYAAAKNNEFNDANGSSLRLANEAPTRKMKSLFHQRASQVGHAIHSTSQKLERLAQLAKRSGAFDDSSQEINTISFAVKEDIKELNTAIAELQRLALHEREQKTKQSTQHSETIVESLKGRLMDATRAFKDVLSERKENVKNNERRRSMFGGSGSSSLQQQQMGGGGFAAGTGRFASVSAAATTGSFMNVGARSSEQQQQQQGGGGNFSHMNPIAFNQNQVAIYQDQDQNYATSRADAMQNVERTITELGGIFQQLATMVNEQGEMAIRIDENVEDVVANVDQAQGELLKYLNYISNNRWLAMKVFGVLMAFLMFFIVFVA